MKTKLIIITLAIFSSAAIHAQNEKQILSVEFAYGVNQFDMGALNQYYIDSFAARPGINLLEERITSGQHFRLGVNYRPIVLLDIGIYGNYQFGNSEASSNITFTDELGTPIGDRTRNFALCTEAIGAGISTTWYISHLLKFQEKENKLNRVHLGVELNGGIGFSRAISELTYEIESMNYEYEILTSRDFQGQGGIKLEYDLTTSSIFTTLGIRLGYQYFNTQTLQNLAGNDWLVNTRPINLDFSGGYFGVYVKIGR